jgi:hypothetical protein
MKRAVLVLAALALMLGGVGQARAGLIQITSASGLSAGDTTAAFTGADGSFVSTPYILSAGGNTLTYTETNGNQFKREQQDTTFLGNFPTGTALLHTANAGVLGAFGPVTISFATAVGEVGLGAQSEFPGTHTFTIAAFDGATSLGSFNVAGDGFVSFLGVRATGGDVITKITISSDDNNFAMAEATFGSPAVSGVPEPSTLTLLGLGSLGLLGYGWRRRKRAVA